MKRTLFAALAAFALSNTAANAETLVVVGSDLGNVVAAANNGMTLYTFRKDAANQSNCYDSCADAWPPFTASASAQADGALGVIDRNDGTRQWALNGKPLYFWQGDAASGDATGHGVGGVWDVVKN